tara:strand:+ start:95 stop:922 length:828 start_codon:yes stop_codon:yes gene_type:complete
MKKLILLLLFIPLVSFGQTKDAIEEGIKELQSMIPMDANGMTLVNAINENDTDLVYVYDLQNDNSLNIIKNLVNKSTLIKNMMSNNGSQFFITNNIVGVWRYYYNKELIKEIKIKPSDYNFSENNFDIELPENYVKSDDLDSQVLLEATSYKNEEFNSMMEIRSSDDWSFEYLSNEDYIDDMIKMSDSERISTLSVLYKNISINLKKSMYLKNVGDSFLLVYSGDYISNEVRITNAIFQFIKKNKLYTITFSSAPESFTYNFNEYLEILDTLIIN